MSLGLLSLRRGILRTERHQSAALAITCRYRSVALPFVSCFPAELFHGWASLGSKENASGSRSGLPHVPGRKSIAIVTRQDSIGSRLTRWQLARDIRREHPDGCCCAWSERGGHLAAGARAEQKGEMPETVGQRIELTDLRGARLSASVAAGVGSFCRVCPRGRHPGSCYANPAP